MFCEYKDIFGKVNEGIHSYRLFNVAIVDVLFTIILAYVIKLIEPNFNFIHILIFLFILSIILHHLFCVKSTVDKLLFD